MIEMPGLGIGFSMICSPALGWLRDVRKCEYSINSIREYGKKIVIPMGLALVYFQGIAKFMPIL